MLKLNLLRMTRPSLHGQIQFFLIRQFSFTFTISRNRMLFSTLLRANVPMKTKPVRLHSVLHRASCLLRSPLLGSCHGISYCELSINALDLIMLTILRDSSLRVSFFHFWVSSKFSKQCIYSNRFLLYAFWPMRRFLFALTFSSRSISLGRFEHLMGKTDMSF